MNKYIFYGIILKNKYTGEEMDQKKIDRINELSRISRERELTEEEQTERKALRLEYIESYKKSLIAAIENTSVVYPDGHKEKLADTVKK